MNTVTKAEMNVRIQALALEIAEIKLEIAKLQQPDWNDNDVMSLHYEGKSIRSIAAITGINRGKVWRIIKAN